MNRDFECFQGKKLINWVEFLYFYYSTEVKNFPTVCLWKQLFSTLFRENRCQWLSMDCSINLGTSLIWHTWLDSTPSGCWNWFASLPLCHLLILPGNFSNNKVFHFGILLSLIVMSAEVSRLNIHAQASLENVLCL